MVVYLLVKAHVQRRKIIPISFTVMLTQMHMYTVYASTNAFVCVCEDSVLLTKV